MSADATFILGLPTADYQLNINVAYIVSFAEYETQDGQKQVRLVMTNGTHDLLMSRDAFIERFRRAIH